MATVESKYVFPELDGEEKLIAVVKHIASALESNKNLTNEARRALVDLGTRLSSLTQLDEKGGETISDIENFLNAVQEKVRRCDADGYMRWDIAGPGGAFEFLNAVDDARKVIERLESLSLDNKEEEGKRDEVQRRAHDVLQKATFRLEEEFKYILAHCRQAFGPECTSFHSNGADNQDIWDASAEGSVYRGCMSRMSEEIIDIVHDDAIPRLRSIANSMFNSKFDNECIGAYIGVRKDAFEEFLFILKVDKKLTIGEVGTMDWPSLKSKIKRWLHAVKIFVRVFLASELCLCNKIFGELGSVTLCFIKASKDSILQLLDFGDAIFVVGPKTPESSYVILDMYEMLVALLPNIDALYMGEEGSSVTKKYHDVLGRLGDHVRATFTKLEIKLASNIKTNPKSGGIHPWCGYVMNHIKSLAYYGETLNVLFKDHDKERNRTEILSTDTIESMDRISRSSSSKLTAITYRFVSLATLLERNLEARSKLYKNDSLRHLFLLNNVHYMVQKVKGSELKPMFGDEWIIKHNWICHKHAMEYERVTWASALSWLSNRDLIPSSATSKILVKERLRNFHLAFEDIYKAQTAWTVTYEEVREDLRISISLKVIPAYRLFIERFCSGLDDKHIKYGADDLENYLLDLFEKSPKSL